MMTTETALKQLQPKVQKSLYYAKPQDREDLEQELNLKIIKCTHDDLLERTPGFWEFAARFD